VDAWWQEHGAARHEVRSELRFARRADLAAVLHIEFPAEVADAWLRRNPAATGLSYGYVLFAARASGLSGAGTSHAGTSGADRPVQVAASQAGLAAG
jgi:hypothetical protein